MQLGEFIGLIDLAPIQELSLEKIGQFTQNEDGTVTIIEDEVDMGVDFGENTVTVGQNGIVFHITLYLIKPNGCCK